MTVVTVAPYYICIHHQVDLWNGGIVIESRAYSTANYLEFTIGQTGRTGRVSVSSMMVKVDIQQHVVLSAVGQFMEPYIYWMSHLLETKLCSISSSLTVVNCQSF